MPVPFSFDLPYPSRRQPILARNTVATSQPLAAQAGLQTLAAGGNAIDAALTAAITLTVVEPTSNGLGSDLFALVWDGAALHGLNASGCAPAAWSPEYFARKHGGTMPVTGWDTVTIPGAVGGWAALSTRFGRLPFARLFNAAIRYARDGYPVSPTVAAQWARQRARFAPFPDFGATFLPDGNAPEAGSEFRCPTLADSLQAIAESLGDDFYRGRLAEAMAADSQAHGGLHTVDDFAAFAPEWVAPLQLRYRDHEIHELPPNGQGIAALLALGILEHTDYLRHPVDSPASLHLQIEAMKLAFSITEATVADQRATTVAPEELLSERYLAAQAARIDANRAGGFDYRPPRGGTVYLTAADAEGRMVSLIQSNYMGFGSGIVVPGTGISLQNRGACFNLTPGHPNQVAGGKRPLHTIIPGFITRAGQPVCSFGVMGGPMQPQGHLQTLVRILGYGQNPQAALDAPRWKVGQGLRIDVENAMPEAVRHALAAYGHLLGDQEPAGSSYGVDFGAGQFIWRLENGYLAASDPRRDGQAVGF